jgi:hypothetical protein
MEGLLYYRLHIRLEELRKDSNKREVLCRVIWLPVMALNFLQRLGEVIW